MFDLEEYKQSWHWKSKLDEFRSETWYSSLHFLKCSIFDFSARHQTASSNKSRCLPGGKCFTQPKVTWGHTTGCSYMASPGHLIRLRNKMVLLGLKTHWTAHSFFLPLIIFFTALARLLKKASHSSKRGKCLASRWRFMEAQQAKSQHRFTMESWWMHYTVSFRG